MGHCKYERRVALGSLTTLRVGGGLVVAAGGSMSGVDPASSPRQFARAQSPRNAPVANESLLLARSLFSLHSSDLLCYWLLVIW